MKNALRIIRRTEPGLYRLEDVYPDIRAYGILKDIFEGADEIDRVISHTKFLVADMPHLMFVDNKDGSITIGLHHLRSASDEILYLDIVHELCHVKQQMQGRDLYDRSKSYVDRETEIEAYEVTVREARRIGFDDEAIANYLRVPWITPEEHRRFLHRLGVSALVSS